MLRWHAWSISGPFVVTCHNHSPFFEYFSAPEFVAAEPPSPLLLSRSCSGCISNPDNTLILLHSLQRERHTHSNVFYFSCQINAGIQKLPLFKGTRSLEHRADGLRFHGDTQRKMGHGWSSVAFQCDFQFDPPLTTVWFSCKQTKKKPCHTEWCHTDGVPTFLLGCNQFVWLSLSSPTLTLDVSFLSLAQFTG